MTSVTAAVPHPDHRILTAEGVGVFRPRRGGGAGKIGRAHV